MEGSTSNRLYTIQDIPGKGLGLVAGAMISKGTRILTEAPLFTVSRFGGSKDRLRDTISQKIRGLGQEQRQAFFSLHNSFEDEDGPEVGRVRTNSLPLGSNATTGGIFLEASRINHSCIANAQNTWNEALQKLTIHAVTDITAGEEITILYLHVCRNRGARRQALQTMFRFTCSCALCSLPPDQCKTSDERWDEIARLDDVIGDGMGINIAPLQTLHNVHKLLTLLDAEGCLDASVPRAYYDAFQIAITHGDIARAKVFAERAASTRAVIQGSDSPTVQQVERLARDPSQHMAHGFSKKWVTGSDDVPQGLEKDDFERWLWRKEIGERAQYANLRSETSFPSFDNLPDENQVDMEYYTTEDGFSFSPRRHWCFLGEIVDVETFVRMRLIVKDKMGCQVPIAFHTDSRGFELGPSRAKKGFTVAVLYAEQHGFLDLSVGIRHENPAAIKIIPLSLGKLLDLNDRIQNYAKEVKGKRVCQGCNEKAATLKCSQCGLFWYCNKACQIVGWKEKGHKSDCNVLKDADLQKMFLMSWDDFEHYHRFGGLG